MTPQALNEAIAQKLGVELENLKALNYCEHISAAWNIVFALRADKMYVSLEDRGFDGRKWLCTIKTTHGAVVLEEKADTAPMVICLAFLKLSANHTITTPISRYPDIPENSKQADK